MTSHHIPGYLPKWTETLYPHNNLQWMLAVVFITGQTWKESRCPSVDNWINKLWYMWIVKYYSMLKEIKYQALKIHRENLSARSQSLETMYDMFPTTCYHGKGKTMEGIKRLRLSEVRERKMSSWSTEDF